MHGLSTKEAGVRLMRWVIDDVEVVHVKHCAMAFGRAVDYKVVIATTEAMAEHLARPDTKDRRTAPGPLVPCDQCILDLPLDIGEVA